MHSGQHRLLLGKRDHPGAPILAQRVEVDGGIDMLLEIAVKIEMVARPPDQIGPDAYEPNDTIAESAVATGTRGTPSFIAVGSRIDNLNFYPYPDRPTDPADWFQFYGRSGSIYQITTLNVQPGVETVLGAQ